MDPQQAFCPNLGCPARGQVGKGNIGNHSLIEQRYHCTVCDSTFSARDGTVFFRSRTDYNLIIVVLTLVAFGCPIPAIVAAFGFQDRTVRAWIKRAGAQCAGLHQELVVVPRDLGQVQADEVRVKTQAGILWLAMGIAVSTRLWLGGVVSSKRDMTLIRRLTDMIAGCALPGAPLLVGVDGLVSYVRAFGRSLRSPVRQGQAGRPRLVSWPGVVLGQVVKQYKSVGKRKRLVAVVRRLAVGSAELLGELLLRTQGGGVLNTSYIERLNGTFRGRLSCLARRTRCGVKQPATLEAGMWLVGTVYNFCTFHKSLARRDSGAHTPVMAAGISDHCWSVAELLHHQVAPPRWQPPKQRGRRSKAMQQLIERWAA